MRKTACILALASAMVISNIGVTTSFAAVNNEHLSIQKMSIRLKNEVVIQTDGTVKVPGPDGRAGTSDDITVTKGHSGQTPKIDQFGNVTLPTGGRVEMPNGTVVYDIGDVESIIVPGGSVVTPNDVGPNTVGPTVNADGSVNVPEGSMVVLPIGYEITPPKGSKVISNGDIITSSGLTIKTDGTVKVPGADGQAGTSDDVKVKPYVDINGYGDMPIVDEFGNVKLPAGGQVEMPSGTIVYDTGSEQSIVVPGGSVVKPNVVEPTVNTDGSINVPNGGVVVLPMGQEITPPNGSVVKSNGDINTQSGVDIKRDGTIVIPGPDGQLGTQDDIMIKSTLWGQIPTVDEFGNVTLLNGGQIVLTDGSVVYNRANPNSVLVPAGTIVVPRGTIVKPNDDGDVATINVDGTVNVPEGSTIVLPSGHSMTAQKGSVVGVNGTVTSQNGTIINLDGSITNPDGSTTNPGGSITNPDGSTTNPGGSTTNPGESTTNPGGSTTNPGGSTTNPGESTTNPGGSTTNPGESTTNPGQNVTKPSESVIKPNGNVTGVKENDANTENPKTGDKSIIGILVLASIALLALVRNIKINSKVFSK